MGTPNDRVTPASASPKACPELVEGAKPSGRREYLLRMEPHSIRDFQLVKAFFYLPSAPIFSITIAVEPPRA